LFSTIALAVHNFPEGLLLFLTTYASTNIGTAVAIGLIFHKIPEGLVISLPYYYITGKPFLGFLFAMLCGGIFQFFGAIIGYIIVIRTTNVDQAFWGVILSIAAGILFYIGVIELPPQAYKYDPNDVIRTYAFFFGVTIIAISEMILSLV